MNLKVFFVILLLLCMIGWGWWYWNQSQSDHKQSLWKFRQEEKPVSQYAKKETEKVSQSEDDAKIYDEAVNHDTLESCQKIHQNALVQKCQDTILSARAFRAKDIDLCTGLSNSGVTMQCQDAVIYAAAKEAHDANICDQIGSDTVRTECQDALTSEKISASLASWAIDPTLCNASSVSGTVSTACQNRVTQEEDGRIFERAIDEKSLSLCENIQNTDTKRNCRDALFLDSAVSTNSIEICKNISVEEKIKQCQERISVRSDAHKYQEALKAKNLDQCESIQSKEMASQCHDTIILMLVREKNDATLCRKLYSTGILAQCEKIAQ